jgi:hypothetical protein
MMFGDCATAVSYCSLSFLVEWSIVIQAQGDSYLYILQQQGYPTSSLSVPGRISTARQMCSILLQHAISAAITD